MIVSTAEPACSNSYLQIEFADGAKGQSEGCVQRVKKLVV